MREEIEGKIKSRQDEYCGLYCTERGWGSGVNALLLFSSRFRGENAAVSSISNRGERRTKNAPGARKYVHELLGSVPWDQSLAYSWTRGPAELMAVR